MWFRIRRRETNRQRNIKGKVISRRHEYYIEVWRLFHRRRYLRLLPGWREKLEKEQPCNVELTGRQYNATTFAEKADAKTVVYFIKSSPDYFKL